MHFELFARQRLAQTMFERDALQRLPGVRPGDAVDRALAKLESASGDAAASADQVQVSLEQPLPPDT